MAYKVFLSYSTHDLTLVNQIKQRLTSTAVSVFVAEYSVAPGQPLSATIINEIKTCDLFILLWSQSAKGSEWVPQEIGVATSAGKTIVPVLLEKDLALPGFLKEHKYLSAYDDPAAALEWLTKEVYGRATQAAKSQGLVWFGLGALFAWLMTRESDEDEEYD